MKLIKTYASLLVLLLLVSPIFAQEETETETTLPVKKYAEVHTQRHLHRYQSRQHFGTSSTKTIRGSLKN